MSPQTLYIHTETGFARRTLTGVEVPAISALHRTRLALSVAFVTAGVVDALPDGVTAKFVAKIKGAHRDDPKLLDVSADVSGIGTGARYLFQTTCDSVQLQAVLGTDDSIMLRCQIEWQMPGEDDPRLCYPFDLTITQAYSRGPDDEIPDSVANAWDVGLNTRTVRIDAVQTLTTEQRARALANLGLVVTNDELRVLCPDGVTRRAILSDLAE